MEVAAGSRAVAGNCGLPEWDIAVVPPSYRKPPSVMTGDCTVGNAIATLWLRLERVVIKGPMTLSCQEICLKFSVLVKFRK